MEKCLEISPSKAYNVLQNKKKFFGAGCDSLPAVTVRDPYFTAEPVRFQYFIMAFMEDTLKRASSFLRDTPGKRLPCLYGQTFAGQRTATGFAWSCLQGDRPASHMKKNFLL